MVPLAFGTQTAGSVIRPASFCGIVGYKPSFGTISRAGVKPLSDSLDTVGVMARNVADAAFFTAVLGDRPDLRLDDAMARPRIAFYRTPEWSEAGADTIAALDHAAVRLSRAGAPTVEISGPPEQDGLVEAQKIVMDYESARSLSFERITRPQDLSASLRERIAIGLSHSARTYDEARRTVTLARAALPSLFRDFDALLVPAAPGAAPKGLERTGDPIFNRAWTILHLPCITLPGWRNAGGLPVGVQLVARLGDDARLLRAAAFLERALTE
jgi:Asp-tRNA(Asn)/Glu-tRNA(Gln) amidotransferase A subunit family amidase